MLEGGRIACPGYAVGSAKVVHRLDKLPTDDLRKDFILVSRTTEPEMTPLMYAARGIITDFGGVTSHAASVARELGKPCLVGTEKATEVIRDLDEVILDVSNAFGASGKVYIIRR